jgi:molybdate transport system substrate-binding protein
MPRIFIFLLALIATTIHAEEVTVAVAANFAAPMLRIAAAFESDTGHHAKLVVGATGAFYTQIRNGAPFDVLLAADAETSARLEGDALAVRGSRFTYALGRLALWSAKPGVVDEHGDVLKRQDMERIAIANPKLAPYGKAAVQTMRQLGVYERLKSRVVQGENIAQTFQFVATGNATIGFVALSQVVDAKGSKWIVPDSLHAPIEQDAVLLARGRDNAAALALMQYLKGDKARGIIRAYGYGF